jgi:hypothetical protein
MMNVKSLLHSFEVKLNDLKEKYKFNNGFLYCYLFKTCCSEDKIDEYIETRKLTKYFNNDE